MALSKQNQIKEVDDEFYVEQSVRRFRFLLLAAAILYPAWMGVIYVTAPETHYGAIGRFLISGICCTLFSLTFVFKGLRRHLERAVLSVGCLISLHNISLVYDNDMNLTHAFGFIIATYAVSTSFERHKHLLIFCSFTALLSLLSPSNNILSRELFLASVLMSLTISYVAFFDKVKLLERLKLAIHEQTTTTKLLNKTQAIAQTGGFVANLASQKVWLSHEAKKLLGMTKKSPSLSDILSKLPSTDLHDLLSSNKETSLNSEVTIKTDGGLSTILQITCQRDENHDVIVALQDITKKRQLEAEAIARADEYQAIVEVVDGIVVKVDRDGKIINANMALSELAGVGIAALVGFNLHNHSKLSELNKFLSKLFESTQGHYHDELNLGKPFYVRGQVIKSGDKAIIVGIDISELKKAEKQIDAQKELLANVVDYLPQGVFVKDAADEFRYVMWNRQMERLFNKTRLEVLGRTDQELFNDIETEKHARADRHVLATGAILDVKEETVSANDRQFPAHMVRVPIRTDAMGTKLILGVMEDISQKKEQDAIIERQKMQLIHASKMSTLGEMSGGVAHEINNPLTIINGFAQRIELLAKSKYSEDKDLVSSAAKIISMAERIAKIVKGLRTFAREGAHDPFESVTLAKIINETLDLCRERFANYGIEIKTSEIPQNIVLECRAVQISQVLLNLLNNSFDAIKDNPVKWVELNIEDLGDRILIREIDSGSGIPPQVIEKMFNPFFTTKEIGSGTGLGLSISRGLVESHRGTLTYDTKNSNTSFIIMLPKKQRDYAAA